MATLVEALALHDRGFAVIPCTTEELEEIKEDGTRKVNKSPVVNWRQYQTQRPNRSLVDVWFGGRFKDYHIGAITGAGSGYFVVDLDTGWTDEDRAKLKMPPTLMAKTPSGGLHYYFKHPGGSFRTKTRANVLPHIDVRGDGGFIVLPPSAYPDGRTYEWLNDLPIALPSPETLALVEDRKAQGEYKPTDFTDIVKGSGPGGRTDSAVAIAGALLRYQPEAQWRTLCWPLIRLWNQQNDPPLDEMKLAKDFNGIAKREKERRRQYIAGKNQE